MSTDAQTLGAQPPPIPQPQEITHISLWRVALSYNGRLGRAAFFGFGVLLNVNALSAVLAVAAWVNPSQIPGGEVGLLISVGIPYLYCAMALVVKRLHDFNKPGSFALLYLLLMLVPVLNAVVAIAVLAIPGTNGSNQYGNPTKI